MTRTFSTTLFTLATLVSMWLVAPGAGAAERTWSDVEGTAWRAELISFDYDRKTVTLQNAEGRQQEFATERLALPSQFRILFSPVFLEAFPEDDWPAQRNRILITLTALTAAFFLVGFWIAAIVVKLSFNPFKAVLGWLGSLAVAAFFLFVYFAIARKIPEQASVIIIVGAVLASFFAGMFVSIIYKTKIFTGLVLFVLHFALGVLLFMGVLHLLDRFALPDSAQRVVAEKLFEPLGLL